MDKQKIIILSLAIALILVLNYFLMNEFLAQKQSQMEEAFLSGRNEGVKETITQLYDQTEDCNIVPIIIENASKKIVDLDCLALGENPNP